MREVGGGGSVSLLQTGHWVSAPLNTQRCLSYWRSLVFTDPKWNPTLHSRAGLPGFESSLCPIPLQYSCLENPMDRGAWWATVHGVAKSWTQLSD